MIKRNATHSFTSSSTSFIIPSAMSFQEFHAASCLSRAASRALEDLHTGKNPRCQASASSADFQVCPLETPAWYITSNLRRRVLRSHSSGEMQKSSEASRSQSLEGPPEGQLASGYIAQRTSFEPPFKGTWGWRAVKQLGTCQNRERTQTRGCSSFGVPLKPSQKRVPPPKHIHTYGCGSKPMVPFWLVGEFTTNFRLPILVDWIG